MQKKDSQKKVYLYRSMRLAGAGLRSALQGLVPVPRLFRGPQPRDEGETRDSWKTSPPGSLAGASHGKPRAPRLPGCRPGRRRDASRPWVPLPVLSGILQLVTCR